MKPLYRGMAVAALQCLMVLSLAGKYAVDRQRLPRAWARALPVDPNLPIRGRYVSVRLQVEATEALNGPVQLSAQGGQLVAAPATSRGSGTPQSGPTVQGWTLQEPVAFFIPESAPDPSRREPGEDLWIEVSVPRNGPPRPIRLGVKKNGVLTPLELR